MTTYWQRLADRTNQRGTLCVGIDPHPGLLKAWGLDVNAAGLETFARRVVEVLGERVAVFKAMSEGVRGGLEAVAVTGPEGKGGGSPITPCGVCRQVLTELAQLGGTDPDILCVGDTEVRAVKLSELLPDAFGPASLA